MANVIVLFDVLGHVAFVNVCSIVECGLCSSATYIDTVTKYIVCDISEVSFTYFIGVTCSCGCCIIRIVS